MEKVPAFKLLGAAFYIGLCILLGLLGGIWLDRETGKSPIFILVGLILGLVLAFWGFYQMIIPLMKENSKLGKKRERR